MGILSELHPKRAFDSAIEVEQFERIIERLVAAGEILEVRVRKPHRPNREEHWFQDVSSGIVYRYIPPEFPARGMWEPIP